jgi:hypothetical protein
MAMDEPPDAVIHRNRSPLEADVIGEYELLRSLLDQTHALKRVTSFESAEQLKYGSVSPKPMAAGAILTYSSASVNPPSSVAIAHQFVTCPQPLARTLDG